MVIEFRKCAIVEAVVFWKRHGGTAKAVDIFSSGFYDVHNEPLELGMCNLVRGHIINVDRNFT
jgi:hypothetical protein